MLNPPMEVFWVVVAGQNEAVASFSLHHMDWTVHMAYPECKGLGISDFKPKGAFQSHFVFRQSWFYKFLLSCFFSFVLSLSKPIEHSPSLLVLPHFPLKPFQPFVSTPTIRIDANNATVHKDWRLAIISAEKLQMSYMLLQIRISQPETM